MSTIKLQTSVNNSKPILSCRKDITAWDSVKGDNSYGRWPSAVRIRPCWTSWVLEDNIRASTGSRTARAATSPSAIGCESCSTLEPTWALFRTSECPFLVFETKSCGFDCSGSSFVITLMKRIPFYKLLVQFYIQFLTHNTFTSNVKKQNYLMWRLSWFLNETLFLIHSQRNFQFACEKNRKYKSDALSYMSATTLASNDKNLTNILALFSLGRTRCIWWWKSVGRLIWWIEFPSLQLI